MQLQLKTFLIRCGPKKGSSEKNYKHNIPKCKSHSIYPLVDTLESSKDIILFHKIHFVFTIHNGSLPDAICRVCLQN